MVQRCDGRYVLSRVNGKSFHLAANLRMTKLRSGRHSLAQAPDPDLSALMHQYCTQAVHNDQSSCLKLEMFYFRERGAFRLQHKSDKVPGLCEVSGSGRCRHVRLMERRPCHYSDSMASHVEFDQST